MSLPSVLWIADACVQLAFVQQGKSGFQLLVRGAKLGGGVVWEKGSIDRTMNQLL